MPRHLIEQAVHESQAVHPAVRIQLEPRPDRDGLALGSFIWTSPGNVSHHPTRRTTIMLLDDADRLLSVPQSRLRDVLDRIHDWDKKIGHPVAVVLIGSPALAATVADLRTAQVIRLEAMSNDAEFATVAAMVCGARDPEEVASLHRSSSGLMARLCHIARMRGLTPPYDVRPDDIARLPAPVAHD